MNASVPTRISGVTAVTKANVYFDGRVVSHTLEFADGRTCTLGLIFPGTYHFGTAKPERMEIVDGACSVVLDGSSEAAAYAAGHAFEVPGQSGFTISVEAGICQYICHFIEA
ncbi:MAG: pyrimidine/purine nucleoside phosphorylase [Opitutales bacterium]|nr:pyrimidine/purine nucleoside phosphorylase [Opitutales bacterium]